MKVAKQGFVENGRGREGEGMQCNHLTGALSGEFLNLKICALHTLASSSGPVRSGVRVAAGGRKGRSAGSFPHARQHFCLLLVCLGHQGPGYI